MSLAGISVAVKFVFKKKFSSPLFDTSKLVDKFEAKWYFSMISGVWVLKLVLRFWFYKDLDEKNAYIQKIDIPW